MRLGIDASNIRGGGGLTHLRQMLAAADPPAHGFEQVVVWAPQSTLEQLKNQPWLLKRHDRALESHYLLRAWWQSTRLGVLARHEGCDLLFVPGGPFATEFRPVVTMSRNLLPFEWRELRRYGCSSTTLRLLLLRGSLTRSFRRASGTEGDLSHQFKSLVTYDLPFGQGRRWGGTANACCCSSPGSKLRRCWRA